MMFRIVAATSATAPRMLPRPVLQAVPRPAVPIPQANALSRGPATVVLPRPQIAAPPPPFAIITPGAAVVKQLPSFVPITPRLPMPQPATKVDGSTTSHQPLLAQVSPCAPPHVSQPPPPHVVQSVSASIRVGRRWTADEVFYFSAQVARVSVCACVCILLRA